MKISGGSALSSENTSTMLMAAGAETAGNVSSATAAESVLTFGPVGGMGAIVMSCVDDARLLGLETEGGVSVGKLS